MKIAVICIGDELLNGTTRNDNLFRIGEKLLASGILPELSLEVPDKMESIRTALETAFSRADFVITTGGLGPTADDITKEAAADFFKLKFEQDEITHNELLRLWNKLKKEDDVPSRFLNQSMVPEGAKTFRNHHGTAPGLLLETERGTLVMLPGPPAEMEPMLEDDVLPLIHEKLEKKMYSVLFHVAGLPESVVEERMLPVISPGVKTAYCASPGHVRLYLSSRNMDLLREKMEAAKEIFAAELLSKGAANLQQEIVKTFRRAHITLATAESCTGGMIAERITQVPGSSDIFLGSVVSYSNQLKQSMLGVKEETLEEYGAVSRETCEEMLAGITERTGADSAIAVTGIAGPDGGTLEKPVGLVWIGVRLHGETVLEECHFRGGRDSVREQTCAKALNLLRLLFSAERKAQNTEK